MFVLRCQWLLTSGWLSSGHFLWNPPQCLFALRSIFSVSSLTQSDWMPAKLCCPESTSVNSHDCGVVHFGASNSNCTGPVARQISPYPTPYPSRLQPLTWVKMSKWGNCQTMMDESQWKWPGNLWFATLFSVDLCTSLKMYFLNRIFFAIAFICFYDHLHNFRSARLWQFDNILFSIPLACQAACVSLCFHNCKATTPS